MVAQRVEDDPRVAAPDVQDVGADRQRVEQPDRLLEQVRQRQQRDEPVLHRRDDPVERSRSRRRRCRGRASRPSACPVVPEVKTSSKTSLGGRAAARPPTCASQSGGKVVVGLGGERLDGRRREAVEAGLARIRARRGPVPRIRWRGAGRADDALDRVGRHAQVERDEDQAGPHRPEVGGRQLGRRRRPGQQPVARLEAERAQPPGGDPRPPVELAVRPVRGRAVVESETERGLVAIGRDGLVEQVEQGLQGSRTS